MESGKKPTEANVRARIDEGGNGTPELAGQTQQNHMVAYLKTL